MTCPQQTSANGIEPTYANIHGLQAGASLNLPDMGSLSEGQLSAALSHGGQLISADQRITDERNAYARQVQARAAFASAAASAPPGGTLSADDIEFASRILSQPATAGAAGAGGYVSNTFTPLGLRDRALSTYVRGGFDAYGNSTANTSEFDLGSVLKQGSIGFLKGTINSVPSTLMGLANGITQGAVIQGELEAGVDVRTALADGRQATAGWWNGQVFSYDNSVQRGFGFLGELAGPVGELKALSLVRDGIVAADFGATLDRMAYSFGTRTGTILSITEPAPTAVGEVMGRAQTISNMESVAPGSSGATATESAGLNFSLDSGTIESIQSMPKGMRPDPSTYMPVDAIDAQLGQFDNGASRFMSKSNLEKYGPAQRDGTSFVMTNQQADLLIQSTSGDARAMEQALGLPDNFLNDNELVRVDVPSPRELNLRIPSGNEAGANDFWIPGGKLPTGNLEAVIDLGGVPASRYNVTPLKF